MANQSTVVVEHDWMPALRGFVPVHPKT